MNERIRELARQSGGIDMTNHVAGGTTTWVGTGTPEFLERFAESIVQECCKTLEEMHMWQSVNNQNYPSAWHNAVDQGIDNIKQHFQLRVKE